MIEFLNRIKTLRTLYRQSVPVELIRYPKGLLKTSVHQMAKFVPYYAEFYKLPNGFFIPKLGDWMEASALSHRLFVKGVYDIGMATVHEINVELFADYVDLNEEAGTLTWYDRTGLREIFHIEDTPFYESLVYNLDFKESPLVEGAVGEEIIGYGNGDTAVEAAVDLDTYEPGKGKVAQLGVTKMIDIVLTSPPGDEVDPKVSMLIGHTGLAKSAMVKNVAKKNNMKLVDIRCGFIDKTDVEGLTNVLEKEGVYEQAPMQDLMQASDQYLKNVRTFVANHKGEKLDGKDKEVYEQMVKEARTPVIFWDEINRAPKSVRRAFTNILNQKRFLTYTFKEAKMIAAANIPVFNGEYDEDQMKGFYSVENPRDIGGAARYTPILVDPHSEDMRESWLAWAESGRTKEEGGKEVPDPIEPEVLQFLEKNPEAMYDLSSLGKPEDVNNPQAPEEEPGRRTDIKVTTYRGWEQLNNFFKVKMKPNKTIPVNMIKNILGDTKATAQFISFLKKKKYTVQDTEFEKDDLSDTLEGGMAAGVPVLLAGATSTGKTSRVTAYAREHENEVVLINIDLSLKERTQMKGVPHPFKSSEVMLPPGTADSKLGAEMANMLDKDLLLPEEMTSYVPDKILYEETKRAKDEGKKLLIFFDECNRADPVVQSAMFEAISDNRFMGVTFEPGMLQVVGACNVASAESEAVYGDATRLGAALTGRFMMARKLQPDETDRLSFIEWAKTRSCKDNKHTTTDLHAKECPDGSPYGSSNIDASLIQGIEMLGPDKFQEMMKLVDETSMRNNTPSTRSIQSLSYILKTSKLANSFMRGFMITQMDDFDNFTDAQIKGYMEDPQWVGNQPDSDVWMLIKDKQTLLSGEDIRDTYIQSGNRAKLILNEYETSLTEKRRSLFKTWLGEGKSANIGVPIVDTLLDHYSLAERGRILLIADLVDSSLTGKFVRQQISSKDIGVSKGIEKAAQLFAEIITAHRASYQPSNILEVMTEIGNYLPSHDARTVFVKTWQENPILKDVTMGFDASAIKDDLDKLYA